MLKFQTLYWKDSALYLLNQLKLPHQQEYVRIDSLDACVESIQNMIVRGAPAIGVTAAYGMVLANGDLELAKQKLDAARPTAVNLSWATERMLKKSKEDPSLLLEEAQVIHREDQNMCLKIGEHALRFIEEGGRYLTHCNAGALATSGIGTALSPFYLAKQQGIHFEVYTCETRPYLQGARLTTWELQQNGIDVTLITDSTAAYLMQQEKIDGIFIGADRIAKNGDVANKIGSYNLAILAKYHNIPFRVLAPSSTFDANCASAKDIMIEERDPMELTQIAGLAIAPKDISVYYPAFDICPAELVTHHIDEIKIGLQI